MQVFRGIPERAEHGCVLTIGNFDGVHRGHQALLTKLTDKARVTGLPSAVLTFEPHPREFFAHDNRPRRLTSLREKIQLLAAHGVDRLYIARFNTSPDAAYQRYAQTLVEEGCEGFSRVHNAMTAAQRFKAVQSVKGYEQDFLVLAAQ